MQIDEDFGVALFEVDAFREEHRGIAMGVECQHPLVNLFGGTELVGLVDQPLEERQPVFTQTFWMPLYAQYRFVLRALHRLDDTVGSSCCHAEAVARATDGLMVEGVDIEFFHLIIYIGQQGVFLHIDTVGLFGTGSILGVLYEG